GRLGVAEPLDPVGQHAERRQAEDDERDQRHEALLGLAAATGLPAARALDTDALPLSLTLLGKFELARGGRPVTLGAGQATQLLKLVAVHGGSVPSELAIEALWPGVAPDTGRNRLRTVLGRLRGAAPGIVERRGELLVLDARVRVDLAQFELEARQAFARRGGETTAAVAAARCAVARYGGPLLPHDLYDDWADEPRERARRTMLDLLDLCAAAAADRGDLDEARRMVERTVELAPDEDERYLRTAATLLEQGRKGAALSVIARARLALERLGVEPPPELLDFERAIAV
ncbi:MAG TPA: BTAD domain-containing putative transcriptional regulator, partial [Solirubrobacteraceae bacterium]|nr:BTAD domain-containing putative transcriptional regulator [Solirubrobacteraceae bacterium]